MFDDHAVFPCDDDMLCVPEGYLLFYRRAKDHKKFNENLKKKSIYFDYYKNKDKNGKEDDKDNNKENEIKDDIKDIEEDSEGEENEDDES